VTRDYVLDIDGEDGQAPLLSVFGGKITTFRKLAEHAMEKLAPFFPDVGDPWTAGAALPGGDIAGADFAAFLSVLTREYPAMPENLLHRLARAYGTRARTVLGSAQSMAELGAIVAGNLTEAEVNYLMDHEWAQCAEDVLYRRSKLGLHLPPETAGPLDLYMAARAV
jgi:glycerol-3-phosphate dehydrogenase